MSYIVESPSQTECRIAFTIPAQEVEKTIKATIVEFAKSVEIKGFRKGKVPHSVIEKRFDEDVYNRATENLIHQNINAVLESDNIRPINRIQIEDEDKAEKIQKGSDFAFACFFEVLPKIEVPADFTSYTVNVQEAKLGDEEVDAIVMQLRQNMSKLEDVTEARKPESGDVLLVDIEGTIDGEQVPGMAAENFLMQLRDESKNKDVDNIVRDLMPGEEGKGTMTCPEDFPEEELRGKTIDLVVRLHKIQKHDLPELNDDFAKNFGFESADNLKQAVISQAMNSKMGQMKQQAQETLLNGILESFEYELPKTMLNASTSNYMAEAQHHLGKQNLSPEEMVQALANMKEKGEETAKKDTKAHVFLLTLAQREAFTVTGQEVELYINQLAMETKQEYEKVRNHVVQSGMVHEIQERILAGKALDFIYSQAQKNTVDAEGNVIAEKAEDAAE